jgi:hypothetical protein
MISQALRQEAAMKVKDHLPLSELKRLERIEKNADRAKRLRRAMGVVAVRDPTGRVPKYLDG